MLRKHEHAQIRLLFAANLFSHLLRHFTHRLHYLNDFEVLSTQ